MKRLIVLLFSVINVVLAQNVESSRQEASSQRLDITQPNTKFELRHVQSIRKKYNLNIPADSLPRYLQVMDNTLRENYFLIKDQNLSQRDYAAYDVGKKLWGGMVTDSVSYFRGKICFYPPDPQRDSNSLVILRKLGVVVESFHVGPGGFNVLGKVPLLNLEAISRIKGITQLMPIPREGH